MSRNSKTGQDIRYEGQGRPSLYTPELAERICAELAKGRTLKSVCRDEGMPVEATVRAWALDKEGSFFARYAKAREIGYLVMADETIDIADDGTNDYMARLGPDGETAYVLNGEHVQRSRLRVDTRKWLLSKALPKLYGDRIAVTDPDGGEFKINHSFDLSGLSEEQLEAIAAAARALVSKS